MVLKLYANLKSQPCRAVAWIAQLKGLKHEIITTYPPQRTTQEFWKVNPNGLVPAIDDEGFSLFEGNAILTYLANKHGWSDLYPEEVQKRAKVDQYLHWHHANARKCTTHVIHPMLHQQQGVATKEEDELEKKKAETIGQCVEKLQHFMGDPYIAGTNEPTLADFSCYTEFDQIKSLGIFDFSKYPQFDAWMKRMENMPLHKEIHETMEDFLTTNNLK